MKKNSKSKKSWWKRFAFWSDSESGMDTRPKAQGETDPRAIGEKTEGGKTFFGIKWTMPFVLLMLAGCANYSTTKFTYQDGSGASVSVEMPKEIVAKNLRVTLNAKSGEATITADDYNSQNQGTIDAGTTHDVQVINAMGKNMSQVLGDAAAAAAKSSVGGGAGGLPFSLPGGTP